MKTVILVFGLISSMSAFAKDDNLNACLKNFPLQITATPIGAAITQKITNAINTGDMVTASALIEDQAKYVTAACSALDK